MGLRDSDKQAVERIAMDKRQSCRGASGGAIQRQFPQNIALCQPTKPLDWRLCELQFAARHFDGHLPHADGGNMGFRCRAQGRSGSRRQIALCERQQSAGIEENIHRKPRGHSSSASGSAGS